MRIRKLILAILLASVGLPSVHAGMLTFDFTGRLVVAAANGTILINDTGSYTPIAATLSYDTNLGIGSSSLSITMDGTFYGYTATFHDITMSRVSGTDLFSGLILVDWGGNMNMPAHVEWDATGLLTAIDYGLQVGDKLSGSSLYRDANGDETYQAGELVADIGSATPYSDTLQTLLHPAYQSLQGPAPLAATAGTLGLGEGTPFEGIRLYLDIGSGNSMYVTAVPTPAAAWLFGAGLLGLAGLGKRGRHNRGQTTFSGDLSRHVIGDTARNRGQTTFS